MTLAKGKPAWHGYFLDGYLLDWCDSGKCCTSMEQKVIGKKVVGATPLFSRSFTLTPKYRTVLVLGAGI